MRARRRRAPRSRRGPSVPGTSAAVAGDVDVRRDHVRRLVGCRRRSASPSAAPSRRGRGQQRMLGAGPGDQLRRRRARRRPSCSKASRDRRRRPGAAPGRRSAARSPRPRSRAGSRSPAGSRRGRPARGLGSGSEVTIFSPIPTVTMRRPSASSKQVAAALVEGVVAAQISGRSRTSQVMPTSERPRSSSDSATRTTSPAGAAPRTGECGERGRSRGELALHVGGAAPDEPAVALDPALEGRHRPARVGRSRDDVGVAQHHQRRARAAAPRIRAIRLSRSGSGPAELDLDPPPAGLAQVAGEQLGGRGLGSGRVRGVDPDQVAAERRSPRGRGGPRPARRSQPAALRGELADADRAGTAPASLPSSRRPGRAATRQLMTASCAASQAAAKSRLSSLVPMPARPARDVEKASPISPEPFERVGAGPGEAEQRPQRQPAQRQGVERRVGRADGDAAAVRRLAVATAPGRAGGRAGRGTRGRRSCRAAARRPSCSPAPARGGADPAREVEAAHPGAGADRALGDRSGRERAASAASTSAATIVRESAISRRRTRRRPGSTTSSGPRPEAGDRRLVDGADRVRAAEVDGRRRTPPTRRSRAWR